MLGSRVARGQRVVPGPEILVDSGAWLALGDLRDARHVEAVRTYRQLQNKRNTFVTTNLVIAESYESIRRAGGHRWAIQFLESLRKSSTLLKVYSDDLIEARAEDLLRRYDDQRFSFVDAVSFAVMRDRQISEAFAFDHHF